MTSLQKVVKYLAMAFAVFLCISIVGGIFSALSAISFFTNRNDNEVLHGNIGDTQVYHIWDEPTSLKIDILYAELTIKSAEAFSVESNIKNLTVETRGDGTLTVKEEKNFASKANGKKLTVYVPEGTQFVKANISTGAGAVHIESLTADVLDLDLGAGQVLIDDLKACGKADIDGGAGEIRINNAEINDLDIDMGVGSLRFTGKLTGNCDFDLGIGETRLTLLGSSDDYRIKLDKGIGEARIDGHKVSSGTVYGSGDNRIDIEGGIGEIRIEFENN